jgi:hypothetical protein
MSKPAVASAEEWVKRFMEEFDAEELPGEEQVLTSDEKGG